MAGSCREWLGRTARRIATDATWVFVIVMSLSIGSTFFSIRYLSGLESDLGELYENDIKGQTYAQNAYVSLLGMESELKDLIISDGGDERKASAAALRSESASLRSLVLKATPTIDSARYRTLIGKSKADVAAFIRLIQRGIEGSESTAPTAEKAKSLLADLEPSLSALRKDLLTLNEIKRSANRRVIADVRLQLRISLALTILILAVSLAVRIVLFRASRRSSRSASGRQPLPPPDREELQ